MPPQRGLPSLSRPVTSGQQAEIQKRVAKALERKRAVGDANRRLQLKLCQATAEKDAFRVQQQRQATVKGLLRQALQMNLES
jgi:hypothetical protein